MSADPATLDTPAAPAPSAATPDTAARRRRRPGRLSLAGGVLGLAFAAMSVTPSLVPRAWYVQGLLTGLCLVTGYGLGAFLGWAYRALRLPDLPAGARRVAWQVLAGLAVVVLLAGAWLGRSWQVDQHELLGMDASVPWLCSPVHRSGWSSPPSCSASDVS